MGFEKLYQSVQGNEPESITTYELNYCQFMHPTYIRLINVILSKIDWLVTFYYQCVYFLQSYKWNSCFLLTLYLVVDDNPV